ncbi:DUF5818 domain-containing protein [Flavihumibacter profundi]|jgi:hypothetical protein|uniref:DUF5818 domain-containing protein n=1 Tax=Flavihumibacter profundi TaxID=2716883 RepID=UPI001CC4A2B7|nr:DUF5818 domain-containing protein [Flavihumibacter profundi]MBZ5857683.1 DUF5818 domain-containing protein [Flavihumibacter profundi]
MKKLLLILLIGMSINSFAQKATTWTAWVSDSHCGAKGKDASHAECAVKCVKGGAEPVLVVDGKVYKIADPKKITDFVGKKVTVTGTLKGETITIEKVAAAA